VKLSVIPSVVIVRLTLLSHPSPSKSDKHTEMVFALVGLLVGDVVGVDVGANVGLRVGLLVGAVVGVDVGANVGLRVGVVATTTPPNTRVVS
jgi:uncharacterized protein YcfJ